MSPPVKGLVKTLLGELPGTAELYWQLVQQGQPLNRGFSLKKTEAHLAGWLVAAQTQRANASSNNHILIFTTLRYWIEHAVLLSLSLVGQGHQVTLAYLPYANWHKSLARFDLRRQNLYARHVLNRLSPLVETISLLDVHPTRHSLPENLAKEIEQVTIRDVQYTLQIEQVDSKSALYRLRQERNQQAALAMLAWLEDRRPDVLATPNGSILEMGAVYQVAKNLDIPTVTYEFGEQKDRIWLAHNAEVMRQETGELWQKRQHQSLNSQQWERIQALFASRQQASLWKNFSRRWQGAPSQGGRRVRKTLNLDERPLVLLAANVIGDSLTLSRQRFSQSMTEWLQRTVIYFSGQPAYQLVVRIHPGERYAKGPSVADVLRQTLPEFPENIHLVAADDPINTYDLIEIADLGLVYTTTVGMEMAMSGVPVITAGQTHYAQRGFTHDPQTWDAYFQELSACLAQPEQGMSQEQVEQAWNYAYRFFFEFPLPFPWHLLHFWQALDEWPLERTLSSEGQRLFGNTFRFLAGEALDWSSEGILQATGDEVDFLAMNETIGTTWKINQADAEAA